MILNLLIKITLFFNQELYHKNNIFEKSLIKVGFYLKSRNKTRH